MVNHYDNSEEKSTTKTILILITLRIFVKTMQGKHFSLCFSLSASISLIFDFWANIFGSSMTQKPDRKVHITYQKFKLKWYIKLIMTVLMLILIPIFCLTLMPLWTGISKANQLDYASNFIIKQKSNSKLKGHSRGYRFKGR